MHRESFLLIFEVLCFISTACLISKCIHQYYLDDDTSQLEYRKFHHDAGSIYPSISICFPSSSFFDYSAIHKTVMSIPKLARQVSKKCRYSGIGCNSQYLKLLGEIVEVIDYSNVTLQLMKHVSIVEINLQNNGKILWSNEEGKLKLSEAFETILSNGFMIQRNSVRYSSLTLYLSLTRFPFIMLANDVSGIVVTLPKPMASIPRLSP